MGSNPAAGLLLMLAGSALLLGFVTGRLDWLFNMAKDANAARTGAPVPATPPAPAGTVDHPALQTSPPSPVIPPRPVA